MELIVKVYNINEGRNSALVKRSKTLEGYSTFVAVARENRETMDKDVAIRKAIEYCIKEEILETYFRNKGSEVVNMLLTEWDNDRALAVREMEGVERGIRQGIEQGMLKERQRILNLLQKQGIDIGRIKNQLSPEFA